MTNDKEDLDDLFREMRQLIIEARAEARQNLPWLNRQVRRLRVRLAVGLFFRHSCGVITALFVVAMIARGQVLAFDLLAIGLNGYAVYLSFDVIPKVRKLLHEYSEARDRCRDLANATLPSGRLHVGGKGQRDE